MSVDILCTLAFTHVVPSGFFSWLLAVLCSYIRVLMLPGREVPKSFNNAIPRVIRRSEGKLIIFDSTGLQWSIKKSQPFLGAGLRDCPSGSASLGNEAGLRAGSSRGCRQ